MLCRKKCCRACHLDKFIWGSGMCYLCYPHKKYRYKRKPTGELDLFKALWEVRHHICTNCGVGLGSFNVGFFSHIKSKGSCQQLRLDPTNIQILCLQCHYAFDFRGKDAFEKRKKLDF